MKKIIDITVPLSSRLPVWTDSHGVNISRLMEIEKDGWTVSRLDIDVHSGTHIDAPLHIVPNGKTTNEIPLEKLIGNCILPKDTKRLLCKTDNSRHWGNIHHEFRTDFCSLTADAAQWVVDNKIELVGIDYHSIQLYHDPPDTHQILLENEVVILETLNLLDVEPGEYRLICLPLKVEGVEGISVRAVLEKI